MDLWKEFHGPNAGYILEQFEKYQRDPQSVDASIRAFFDHWSPPDETYRSSETAFSQLSAQPGWVEETYPDGVDAVKIGAVFHLAQSIRWYGHLAAGLDPLGSPPIDDPALKLETYGLSEADLVRLPAGLVGGDAAEGANNALEAIRCLREIYSANVGHDYLQIRNAEKRQWLREAAESRRFDVEHQPIDSLSLLDRLTQVETFEHFLQRAFVAKTRFSIEGLDTLIPLLDTVIGCAAESGIFNILIGMAHRGRLNVLAHLLDKPVDQILAEFKDPLRRLDLEKVPVGWAGDVKYHAGALHVLDDNDPKTIDLVIRLAPNPSHLEAVNPVVEGMARAAGTQADKPGPPVFDPGVTLPILIHGDAAFTGQGVVAETLNMYRLAGYTTGGTIHIIANNQIGFTTSPSESRSTLFASDLAKGYRIPILHVNADDPESVIMAARLAFAYRARFRNDFLIDLIGYRRLGHNEGDEPAFTQPEMYQIIQNHPTVRKLWADRLVQRCIIAPELPDQLYHQKMEALQKTLEALDPDRLREPIPEPPPPGAARKVKTSVPLRQLNRINQDLLRLPDGFNLHSRLARIRQRREKIFEAQDAPSIDWSVAEELALATILQEGIPIRLTGQDVERGTFSHRHAVLHDSATGEQYIPLHHLAGRAASFEVINSPLSEYAALGFEFGYNVQAPERLVIWEAQYGDFINNAQTIVDEFIVSARDKWGQLPSLVLLLPHGYEGQGPDHSSGRLERFLNLSADLNLRVANCTTSANYFHLLRRQASLLMEDPLPLIIMTPKSLLRHPLVFSQPRSLSEGGWMPVIDRQPLPARSAGQAAPEFASRETVRRLVFCSGKVYVDLVSSELASQRPEVGVVRLEQLAPFPTEEVSALLQDYPNLEEIVWAQEEPENMGALNWVRPHLEKVVSKLGEAAHVAGGQSFDHPPLSLRFLSRPRAAAPAEGSSTLHAFNQKRLVDRAYEPSQTGGTI